MTGIQKPQEEKLKQLMQEIQSEILILVPYRDFYACVVRNFSAGVIKELMRGLGVLAWGKLRQTYRMLSLSKRDSSSEAFYEALCAFDLGCFAYALWMYFSHFEEEQKEMVNQIWCARKDFMPSLADVLVVSYTFTGLVRNDWRPWDAFYYGLASPNYMHETFGQSLVYQDKFIGHILSDAAMKKLKEILRAYMRKLNSGGGSRP